MQGTPGPLAAPLPSSACAEPDLLRGQPLRRASHQCSVHAAIMPIAQVTKRGVSSARSVATAAAAAASGSGFERTAGASGAAAPHGAAAAAAAQYAAPAPPTVNQAADLNVILQERDACGVSAQRRCVGSARGSRGHTGRGGPSRCT
eukprot:353460-Chlamydomonas_euryale.AAC.16